MNVKIPFYITSIVLAIIGFPMVLILLYLDMIDSGLRLKFFWVVSVACCVLSIIFFSLARILATWEEEDEQE